MNFLIDQYAFKNALQKVEMGIDRKPTNPMYGGIYIQAQNDSLILMTNDMDMAVRYRVSNVNVNEPGWAVIPGRELVDIVKDLEADAVTFCLVKEEVVELKGGTDKFTLSTLDSHKSSDADSPESFPIAPECTNDPDVVMSKGDFLSMVNSTRFATSKVQNSRFATEGILIEIKDEKATMVGTDGRRLACIARETTQSTNETHKAVLLPKVLDQIYRFGQEEDGNEISIWYLGNLVGFKIGNLESFGRILTGEFPEYSQVLDKSGSNYARVSRESFSRKIKLASHLTSDASASVILKFSENNLEISSNKDGRGNAEVNFEIDYSGRNIDTSFNPSFISEGLKVAHNDNINVYIEDGSTPAKFSLGDDFIYIVMPLSKVPN